VASQEGLSSMELFWSQRIFANKTKSKQNKCRCKHSCFVGLETANKRNFINPFVVQQEDSRWCPESAAIRLYVPVY
jgi:hypothetical protein